MAVTLHPFDDHGALAVFRDLDPYDLIEAQVVRGDPTVGHIALFCDWRQVQAAAPVSVLLKDRGRPFAVLILANTGQAGVAQAAFLSRDHVKWRRPLAQAGLMIRAHMAQRCRDMGIRRVEVRSLIGHPTAAGFLASIGFHREAVCAGFGDDGAAWFAQYAWPAPPEPQPHHPDPTKPKG